jgi:hypothetical protein
MQTLKNQQQGQRRFGNPNASEEMASPKADVVERVPLKRTQAGPSLQGYAGNRNAM